MNSAVIGLDTSNYRTSIACVTTGGEVLADWRELLPVPSGERGLRQSEAVFAHLRQIGAAESMVREKTSGIRIAAVAASITPRDGTESYMPVFQAGASFGRLMAAVLGVPFIGTTHQRGHLEAARFGTELQEENDFLAVHLSGGTTDLLIVQNDRIERIGGSEDLHAGQLVDRAGVAMGLPFPAGPELEKLAERGTCGSLLGCSMEAGDLQCHLSGAETQVQRWIAARVMSHENIAREIYDLLARTLVRMITAGRQKAGTDRVLITGGVAASPLLRQMITDRCRKNGKAPKVIFGKPEMSGDNAVGVALIGMKAVGNPGKRAGGD